MASLQADAQGRQRHKTRLLNCVRRLDQLRFDRQAILSRAKDRHECDLNRVTRAATILGIAPKSVKKRLNAKSSGPPLSPAPVAGIADLPGPNCVLKAEIERFLAKYITLAWVARQVERHATSVQRELRFAGIMPATDATPLGARIYWRGDVAACLASQVTLPPVPTNNRRYAPIAVVFGNNTVIFEQWRFW